jgi:hypothetical protein
LTVEDCFHSEYLVTSVTLLHCRPLTPLTRGCRLFTAEPSSQPRHLDADDFYTRHHDINSTIRLHDLVYGLVSDTRHDRCWINEYSEGISGQSDPRSRPRRRTQLLSLKLDCEHRWAN